MKITSDDGIRFDNFTDKSIAVRRYPQMNRETGRIPGILSYLKEKCMVYVTCSTYKHKTGQLLIYESMDLKHFALKSYIKDTKNIWDGCGNVLIILP